MKTQYSYRSTAQNIGKYLWKQWVRPIGVAAAFVLPLKSSFADWNWVPTGSMKPTILEGDIVWVNKLAYDLKVPFTLKRAAQWAEPATGDVVILFSPEDGTRLVKRVVAGPGDRVAMRRNVLFINGEALSYQIGDISPFKSEIHEDADAILLEEVLGGRTHRVMGLPNRRAMRDFPEVAVPAGQYFVMGDSRDNSKDSRFFGFVERKQIVGRAVGILASMDKNHGFVPRFERFFSEMDD
jgi:signal peptidase I